MDTAVWLGSGAKGELPPGLVDISPAQLTVSVLREVGFLDGLIQTKEGFVVYPTKLNAEV
jgi:hypothetical protein